MPTERYRPVVDRWLKRIAEVGLAETISEITRPDVQLINPGQTADLHGLVARFREVERAFPDAVVTVDDIVEDGQRLVLVVEIRATHLGPLRNIPPTGRPVRFGMVFLMYMEGDQVARVRMFPEFFSAMVQMGIMPEFDAGGYDAGSQPAAEA
jgi:predicted ester cyclase